MHIAFGIVPILRFKWQIDEYFLLGFPGGSMASLTPHSPNPIWPKMVLNEVPDVKLTLPTEFQTPNMVLKIISSFMCHRL